MPQLILSPRYTEDSRALRKAAEQLGWKTYRLESFRCPPELLKSRLDTCIFGELYFAEVVCNSLKLALLGPTPTWLEDLPQEHRLRSLRTDRLGAVRNLAGKNFIKPATGKAFPAAVYNNKVDGPAESQPDDLLVIVCEPVKWEVEVRCFVLDREVKAAAAYSRGGKALRSEKTGWPIGGEDVIQAQEYAKAVFNDPHVHLPRAAVVDVGIIKGAGWAVVEANEAWASGIYGCEPVEALQVIAKASVPLEELNADDQRWVVNSASVGRGGVKRRQ